MDIKEIKEKLKVIGEKNPKVGLIYLFGSRSSGDIGPMSDYDLAIYFDPKKVADFFEDGLALRVDMEQQLGIDNFDLLIINNLDKPELKYDIISQGELIFERAPFRLLIEPRILTEYFDFRQILRKYELTSA